MTNEIANPLENEQKMTTEQMQEFIQAQNKQQLEQFKVKVDKLFAAEGYVLIGIPYIDDDGRVRAQVRIVPQAVQ